MLRLGPIRLLRVYGSLVLIFFLLAQSSYQIFLKSKKSRITVCCMVDEVEEDGDTSGVINRLLFNSILQLRYEPRGSVLHINCNGRSALVKLVLSAQAIYYLIALNVPTGTKEDVTKIQRAFLWEGTDKVTGGQCKVN